MCHAEDNIEYCRVDFNDVGQGFQHYFDTFVFAKESKSKYRSSALHIKFMFIIAAVHERQVGNSMLDKFYFLGIDVIDICEHCDSTLVHNDDFMR